MQLGITASSTMNVGCEIVQARKFEADEMEQCVLRIGEVIDVGMTNDMLRFLLAL